MLVVGTCLRNKMSGTQHKLVVLVPDIEPLVGSKGLLCKDKQLLLRTDLRMGHKV